jgi:D-arabinose 1-dehydrogenase-like Zn-dependent alcohol dehydrogenase
MPDAQHGYRIHRWDSDPTWEEFPIREPDENEVLVKVEACGIGLTVLNCIRGDLSDDERLLPRVPGHEIVGRVVKAGPGEGSSIVGRRVVAYFYLVCGECDECLASHEPRCRNLAGWVGVHRDGGYAPFATLPARNAIPVPEELDPIAASVVPDAVATPVHVCFDRAGISPGQRVAVIGAGGGIGIHLVQVARLCGGEVVGLDATDPKLAALEELGVPAVDSSDFDVLALRWQGDPPDVVIDLLGSEPSLSWSVEALAAGGRLVVLTTFPGVGVTLEPRRLVLRETAVLGSKYASRAEVAIAADLVARGLVRPVIGTQVGPADVLKLHDQVRSGQLLGRGAVRW